MHASPPTRHYLGLCLGGGATGALCTALLFLGWQAFADQNAATDNVPRLIPYHGTLEFNGDPVTATGDQAPWMRFEVYDGNGANAPLLYEQDIQVEVYNGQFTTALGPTGANNTSLEGVVAYADDLYLKLTLLNDPADDTDDIALANSQRLLVAPFALWATRSADFDVGNDLEVARDVGVGNDLRLGRHLALNGRISNPTGDVVVDDPLHATGALSSGGSLRLDGPDLQLGLNDGRGVGADAGQFALSHIGGDTLLMNYNGSFEGGVQIAGPRLAIDGNLALTGNLTDPNSAVTIADDLTVGSNILMNGTDLIIANAPRGDGGRALVQDNNDTLSINHGGDFAGGTRIGGNVAIVGNATAQNGLKIPVNLRRTGPFQVNGRDNLLDFNAGAPNDRSFCSLTRVHLYDDNDDDDHMACILTPLGGNNWRIQSFTTATDHGTQNCIAHCLIWD